MEMLGFLVLQETRTDSARQGQTVGDKDRQCETVRFSGRQRETLQDTVRQPQCRYVTEINFRVGKQSET